jgi:hypothetical protein
MARECHGKTKKAESKKPERNAKDTRNLRDLAEKLKTHKGL